MIGLDPPPPQPDHSSDSFSGSEGGNVTCDENDFATVKLPFFSKSVPALWAFFSFAGLSVLLATLLSAHLIYKHLKYFTQPDHQRYIVRIVFIIPVYAIYSLVSLLVHKYNVYFALFRDCYEAYVLYMFFALCVNYSGGDKNLVTHFISHPPMRLPMPLFIKVKPSEMGMLQYVLIRPTITLLSAILFYFGLYKDGDYSFNGVYLYFAIIINLSVTVALYVIVLFYQVAIEEMSPYKPLHKFTSIKIVIVFVFWQYIIISGMEHFGWIKPLDCWTVGQVSEGLNNLLICFEMFGVSILHIYAFPYELYRVRAFSSAPLIHRVEMGTVFKSVINSVSQRDMIKETKSAFKGTRITDGKTKEYSGLKNSESNAFDVEEIEMGEFTSYQEQDTFDGNGGGAIILNQPTTNQPPMITDDDFFSLMNNDYSNIDFTGIDQEALDEMNFDDDDEDMTFTARSGATEYFQVGFTDRYQIPVVLITANSPVNAATAFNYYLKYYALCSFSWTGDQCNLSPTNVVPVTGTITIDVPSKYRYYMNVCTFGYSTVWWDWPRWEREIDWMAMNGYNMPLASVGQEAIWLQVYQMMGLSETEVKAWLTGPGFLPWNRMGNVDGWGGPISDSWIESQSTLQQLILSRMRSLGMVAVLPGFAGHVPHALAIAYPHANITQLGAWGTFNGTYYLDATDPLAHNISATFITVQQEVYGSDHLYNFDPFNELNPPSNDPVYLKQTAASMYQTMIKADPKAIWVLQGWFLVDDPSFWQPAQTQAFFAGVPLGQMVVLDLWADVEPAWNITNQFYGHDWIWCMLHNFGGRTGMYGRLPFISEAPIQARLASPNMVGTGLTPEAIEQNVVVYDLMSEMAWRTSSPDLDNVWIPQYIARRYGKPVPAIQSAWTLLLPNLFSATQADARNNMGAPESFIGLRPGTGFGNNLYYPTSVIESVWTYFLGVTDPEVLATATFSYDIAEITIQALSNRFMTSYLSMMAAVQSNNQDQFDQASLECMNLISDVDAMAATQPMLMVGNWTSRARTWAAGNQSVEPYEFNARNQITLWGPPGSDVHDYAYHLWSGLTQDFYGGRWQLFIKDLSASMETSVPFNSTAFLNEVVALEEVWNLQTYQYPTQPVGTAYKLSAMINIELSNAGEF
eukprot:gene14956-17683_t